MTNEVSGVNVNINLRLLQTRLSAVMNKRIPFEHVNKWVKINGNSKAYNKCIKTRLANKVINELLIETFRIFSLYVILYFWSRY